MRKGIRKRGLYGVIRYRQQEAGGDVLRLSSTGQKNERKRTRPADERKNL